MAIDQAMVDVFDCAGSRPGRPARWRAFLSMACLAMGCEGVLAQPVVSNWEVAVAAASSGCAAAALGGWYAVSDSAGDKVEIRDVHQSIAATLTREQLTSLTPWMNLNTNADGPVALAYSDSGRLLYIAVCDSVNAPDGQPGDAILRYDTMTGALSLFARIELGGITTGAYPVLAHFRGRLYVAYGGFVRVFRAGMNDAAGSQLASQALGAAGSKMSLAVDRLTSTLYAANGTTLSRAALGGSTLSFTTVGTIGGGVQGLAWSDHYGGSGQNGLYVAYPPGVPPNASNPRIGFVTAAMARGQATLAPSVYLRGDPGLTGVAATADGRLLASVLDGSAILVGDSMDSRLGYDAWLRDEFAQVVRFGKGLVSPDGEPSGWVIDADVQLGWSRFHPATPDGAAWVVLLCLMNDHINADPAAQGIVRTILMRYAGLSPTGPAPTRSADGIFRHWINPATGGVKPGWDPEFSTMSTMKIVLAAARARAFYPGDAEIASASDAIICGVQNWDRYFDVSARMYLTALAAGGPDTSSVSGGWHEGVLFAEQAGIYGGDNGQYASSRWLSRAGWPTATLIAGRSVTGNASNQFSSAFITLYPLLLIDQYRTDVGWQTHVLNSRISHAAWTDDNGPTFFTVFSAGTTRSDWGGYNADSLSDHPGDLTTFPSVMAFTAGSGPNHSAESVAAYQAYRSGARQTFRTGASILYRRSQVDPTYQPDSAGLPDVALGALGLAELLSPGSVAQVLTGAYPHCGSCPSDWNQDGGVDGSDVDAFYADWENGNADMNQDGATDGADVETFFGFWEAGC